MPIALRLPSPARGRAARWLLVAFLVGCGDSPSTPTPPLNDPALPRARGVSLTQVTLTQAVQLDLMKNGATVDAPLTPIARGRDAIVRAFVMPEMAAVGRTYFMRLQIWNGLAKLADLDQQVPITTGGVDGNLQSTVNFRVAGSLITGDFRWRLTIHEATATATPVGSPGPVEWPPGGAAMVTTYDVGSILKVRVVPILYGADGSNRAPDTSAEAVERIRKLLAAIYPAPAVEVSVRAPVTTNITVRGDITGWDELLDFLLVQRDADDPADDVYYYGLFQPAATFHDYCLSSCVVGLAPGHGMPTDSVIRGGIGVWFQERADRDTWAFTLAHELGHMHGRGHAPCGLGSQVPDRGYPWDGAVLGAWGYDTRDGSLKDPDAHKDLMSYCGPEWVSDYTFRGFLRRMNRIATLAKGQALSAPKTRHRMLRLSPKGLRLGAPVRAFEDDGHDGGERLRVDRADGKGRALQTVTARFFPYTHMEGGIVLLPEGALEDAGALAIGAHTLRLGGR